MSPVVELDTVGRCKIALLIHGQLVPAYSRVGADPTVLATLKINQ
jgi:hypothetical protein